MSIPQMIDEAADLIHCADRRVGQGAPPLDSTPSLNPAIAKTLPTGATRLLDVAGCLLNAADMMRRPLARDDNQREASAAHGG